MQLRVVLAAAACAALAGSLAGFAAQNEKKAPANAPPKSTPAFQSNKPGEKPGFPGDSMSPEIAKKMEACMIAGTPGEAHQRLQGMVGSWISTGKFWMDPDSPEMVMEDTGVMVNQWVLGGRWVQMTYKSDKPDPNTGQMFEGLGYFGYDNTKQQYISSWMDNMSTVMQHDQGSVDASGKTYTMKGSFTDPLTKQTVKTRNITRIIDADHTAYEMYHTPATGKEFKVGEIHSTRKK